MAKETIIVKLARHCQESVRHFKGKERDRMVIQYWNGAIGALHSTGHKDADWVSRVGHLLISTRGYDEIKRIVEQADEVQKSLPKARKARSSSV